MKLILNFFKWIDPWLPNTNCLFFYIIYNKGGSVRNRRERGRDDAVFTLSSSWKKGLTLDQTQIPNPRTPNPPFLISSHIFFSYPSSSSSSSHQVILTSQLQPQLLRPCVPMIHVAAKWTHAFNQDRFLVQSSLQKMSGHTLRWFCQPCLER